MPQELPTELIILTLESAYFDVSYTPDRATLAACSLVCHSWRGCAQALLLRSISVLRPATLKRMTSVFDQRPQLGSYVRILEIAIGGDTIDPSELPRILRLVPRLYELVLSLCGTIELSPPILKELRALVNSPSPLVIRSLVLTQMSVQSRVLYQMLQIWPTVQFLRLHSELAGSPPDQRPPFRLYELILFRIPSAENIAWLLADNDNALRFLELRDDPSDALKSALGDQATHIRSLRLPRYNIHSAPLVRQCTTVEELLLWTVPMAFPMRNLPQTIAHFGFRTSLRSLLPSDLSNILNTLSGCSKLSSIVCNPEDTEELQNKTLARGIKVKFRPMLPFTVIEDPVIAHHIPRGRHVNNFSLMN